MNAFQGKLTDSLMAVGISVARKKRMSTFSEKRIRLFPTRKMILEFPRKGIHLGKIFVRGSLNLGCNRINGVVCC